jgi:hypothetical protein
MRTEIERLIQKISELKYRVESYGDLGAESELYVLRRELSQHTERLQRRSIPRRHLANVA